MEGSAFKIVLIALGIVCIILVIELVILFKKSPQSIPIIGRKLVSKIEVVNEIEGFSVELTDEKRLKEYVNKFGLFKEKAIKIRGAAGYQTVKNLAIRFQGSSGFDFFDEHMNKEGKVFAASKAQIINGRLYLLVFLEPTLYEKQGVGKFTRYFSTMVLRGLFLSSRLYQEMALNDKKAKLENLYGEASGLFLIEKER